MRWRSAALTEYQRKLQVSRRGRLASAALLLSDRAAQGLTS
jgi:hypothetical protein